MGNETLLTVGDVAAYLNVPVSRVYDCWRRWRLPALRIGGSLRFRRRDIDRWLGEQSSDGNAW